MIVEFSTARQMGANFFSDEFPDSTAAAAMSLCRLAVLGAVIGNSRLKHGEGKIWSSTAIAVVGVQLYAHMNLQKKHYSNWNSIGEIFP